ncbi:MAG: zinc ribbon domain-containing protein [Candidatus Freyarchaeota archaeon]|nr:zinc ribbon domain-containing protein [Candidatus Jordarchaeia archaeon]
MGEFDDVDLSEEEFLDLIEEVISNLGFIVVKKDWEEGRILISQKLCYAHSVGSLTFKKDKKHVSITISYEITPYYQNGEINKEAFESEKAKIKDSWKNLCTMIHTLFSRGFTPIPRSKASFCPFCGMEIDWDSRFCKYCGEKLK